MSNRHRFAPSISTASLRTYVALSIALIALGALQATHEPWSGDFWEHAAVVRELAAHPTTPEHPLLELPTPHPLFTPYHLGLGLVSRATGMEPVRLLGIVGLVNLALLCFALWQLALTWTGNHRIAPYVLLLTLFFWGHAPWRWSGMLHFGIVGRIAAYPSVVGVALSMLALAAARRHLASRAWLHLAVLGGLTAAVTLVHPLSVPLLLFGTCALCWQAARDVGGRAAIAPIVAIGIGGLAAFAWPYFPLLRLLEGSGEAYDLQQYPIYEHLIERTFPILLALPVLVGRLRKDTRDPIATTFLALAAAIVVGNVSGRFSLGRLLPGAILMVHLSLADWIATIGVPRLASAMKRSRTVAIAAVLAGVLAAAAIAANFQQSWAFCIPGHVDALAPYEFLRPVVQPDDVVLADAKSNAIVPVVAGRVVAVNNALPFVADAEFRRHAVSTFFDGAATEAERNRVIATYEVRWVLVDRGAGANPALESWLRRRGVLVHEDSRFLLVRIAKSAP